MAFFFREEGHRHRSPERRQGKTCNIRGPDPVIVKPIQTRDEYLDHAVKAMGAGTEATGHLLIGKADPPRKTGRLAGDPLSARQSSGPLWGNGKPDTPPAMRIRIGVSDDELRKIWQEDDRKARVADQMEHGPTMVEKMLKCDYPIPHPGHEPVTKKKTAQLQQFREPTDETQPSGFRGMGQFSEPQKPHGPRLRPTEFEPPVLQLKPRQHGRRHIPVGDDQLPIAERPRLIA